MAVQKVKLFTEAPFTLSLGGTLQDIEIAYQTYGELNKEKTNAILICHALTGMQSLILLIIHSVVGGRHLWARGLLWTRLNISLFVLMCWEDVKVQRVLPLLIRKRINLTAVNSRTLLCKTLLRYKGRY